MSLQDVGTAKLLIELECGNPHLRREPVEPSLAAIGNGAERFVQGSRALR
jgi:hypothetical protein